MSNATAVAPERATKAPVLKNAAPSPTPAKPPLSEGDKLALEAAEVLHGMVLHAFYPSSNSDPRDMNNTHLFEADHLLGRLLDPERYERDPADPEDGNILEHLALISSELDGAAEVMSLRDIPGFVPSEQAVLTAVIKHADTFAENLFLAYMNLPGTLEDLRALTTSAGARKSREQPTPLIRRVEEDAEHDGPSVFTRKQLLCVLEVAASNLSTIDHILMMAQTEKEPFALSGLVDAAQALTRYCGGMVDSAAGEAIIGGHNRWNFGPNFADLGKAGAA